MRLEERKAAEGRAEVLRAQRAAEQKERAEAETRKTQEEVRRAQEQTTKKRADELVTTAIGESPDPTARATLSRISRIFCGARLMWLDCSLYSIAFSTVCSICESTKNAGSVELTGEPEMEEALELEVQLNDPVVLPTGSVDVKYEIMVVKEWAGPPI